MKTKAPLQYKAGPLASPNVKRRVLTIQNSTEKLKVQDYQDKLQSRIDARKHEKKNEKLDKPQMNIEVTSLEDDKNIAF